LAVDYVSIWPEIMALLAVSDGNLQSLGIGLAKSLANSFSLPDKCNHRLLDFYQVICNYFLVTKL